MSLSPTARRRRLIGPTLAGGATFLAGTAVAHAILFGALPPLPLNPWPTIETLKLPGDLAQMAVASWAYDIFPGLAKRIGIIRQEPPSAWLQQYGLTIPVVGRLAAETLAGVLCTVPAALWCWRRAGTSDGVRHLRGPRLWDGSAALRHARVTAAAESRAGKAALPGIEIAPGVPLPRERETEGVLVVGAPGAGKTVILRFLAAQVLGRGGDRLVVHDTKGDVTERWPTGDVILLAPQDARSWAWDVAADIRDELAAREFAAALVPEGREPTWAQGGQEILVGVLRELQVRSGTSWGWADLRDALQVPPTVLRERLTTVHPAALAYLGVDENGEFTRTAASYVGTVLAPLARLVRPLAAAWGTAPPERRVSLRAWLLDGEPQRRTVILQRAAHLPEMSRAWIAAAVRILAQTAASPLLEESERRRLWLLLDEFPQLGRLESAIEVLETCRSKGVCAILAAQSLEQIEVLYGTPRRRALESMLRTKIVLRVASGPTARHVAEEVVGRREIVEPPRRVRDRDGAIAPQAAKSEERLVLLPSEIAALGRSKYGPEGFLVGLGSDVYRLAWPYDRWPAQRPAHVPGVLSELAREAGP
jgi:hypothetical protein